MPSLQNLVLIKFVSGNKQEGLFFFIKDDPSYYLSNHVIGTFSPPNISNLISPFS